MNGLVLAGTESGVGKTVAALATIRALERSGRAVQPAKAGPDFIDPSHHAAVSGTPSRTLDSWLEGDDGLRRNYHRGDGDICVVEGVMGLYDGDRSSTAAVAETLDLPIVLVVDGSGSMESVAATAYGFQKYTEEAGRDIDIVGVLSQRTHGGRHAVGIRDALPGGLRYFGRIPPREELTIPERHLGLHTGGEASLDQRAVDDVAEHVDAEALAAVAREPPQPSTPAPAARQEDLRIAVANDSAFQFIYPAVRERLKAGGEVVPFAPVAGEDLPDCDAVYLPGGYPELHAEALEASPALSTLRDRGADGLPVLGECGGLMALSRELTTADGDSYGMAGILPAEVTMRDRYQALDHVELRAERDTLTAGAGERLRGHEFHYSEASVGADARFAFEVTRGSGIDDGRDGLTEYETLGTYCHVHAESTAFDTFLERARG